MKASWSALRRRRHCGKNTRFFGLSEDVRSADGRSHAKGLAVKHSRDGRRDGERKVICITLLCITDMNIFLLKNPCNGTFPPDTLWKTPPCVHGEACTHVHCTCVLADPEQPDAHQQRQATRRRGTLKGVSFIRQLGKGSGEMKLKQ